VHVAPEREKKGAQINRREGKKKKKVKGEAKNWGEKRKTLNVFIKPGTIPNVDQKGSTCVAPLCACARRCNNTGKRAWFSRVFWKIIAEDFIWALFNFAPPTRRCLFISNVIHRYYYTS